MGPSDKRLNYLVEIERGKGSPGFQPRVFNKLHNLVCAYLSRSRTTTSKVRKATDLTGSRETFLHYEKTARYRS